MGRRFRRSVKLFPGVRLNFSKSGISTSIGRPGATVNLGHGKVTTSVGMPGTGISYRESTRTDARVPAARSRAVLWLLLLLFLLGFWLLS
jgi:hypothetical protein